ncbi:MAG: hypothetical protein Q4E01_07505 [Actinomycetaceae bacterium]|nr:hypothetical protein [Actinomycetaceae bacterium]
MTAAAIIFGILFVVVATASVALMTSIFRGAAWQGSPLRLPVRSRDPEVIRHVHRASLPMLGALAFIAVAHGVVLLILASRPDFAPALALAIIVAGVVTTAGLAGTVYAYSRQPHVKK